MYQADKTQLCKGKISVTCLMSLGTSEAFCLCGQGHCLLTIILANLKQTDKSNATGKCSEYGEVQRTVVNLMLLENVNMGKLTVNLKHDGECYMTIHVMHDCT